MATFWFRAVYRRSAHDFRGDWSLSIALNEHYCSSTAFERKQIMEATQVVTRIGRDVGEIRAAFRSDDGLQLWVAKTAKDWSWTVEKFEVVNQAWQVTGVHVADRQLWDQAIQRYNGTIRNPAANEELDYKQTHDRPMRIMSYSEADQSTSIVLCCNQSVHIWTERGEYRVFISLVYGQDFALLHRKVYMSHAPGVFYIDLHTGMMGHVGFLTNPLQNQLEEHLQNNRSFIEGIAIRQDGLFALTVDGREPHILTFLVLDEPRGLRIDFSNQHMGLYECVQFPRSRPSKMVALELFDHPSRGDFLFAPVTIDPQNPFVDKVTGTMAECFSWFYQKIVGVSGNLILIHRKQPRDTRAYVGTAMAMGQALPVHNSHLLDGEITEIGNRQVAMQVYTDQVVLFSI